MNKLQQYELMSSQALQTNIIGQEFAELSMEDLNSSTSSSKEEKEVKAIFHSKMQSFLYWQ